MSRNIHFCVAAVLVGLMMTFTTGQTWARGGGGGGHGGGGGGHGGGGGGFHGGGGGGGFHGVRLWRRRIPRRWVQRGRLP